MFIGTTADILLFIEYINSPVRGDDMKYLI